MAAGEDITSKESGRRHMANFSSRLAWLAIALYKPSGSLGLALQVAIGHATFIPHVLFWTVSMVVGHPPVSHEPDCAQTWQWKSWSARALVLHMLMLLLLLLSSGGGSSTGALLGLVDPTAGPFSLLSPLGLCFSLTVLLYGWSLLLFKHSAL